MVTSVLPQGNGSKYVVLSFNVNGLRVDRGAAALPGSPLWAAAPGQVWTVSVNAADTSIWSGWLGRARI